jgi:hypothetical protein
MTSVSDNDTARFWARVDKTGECWIWTGMTNQRPTSPTGHNPSYGRFKLNGKITVAHRVSYTIHHGQIPPGLCVCHRCDVPLCVNPDHLFLATQRENVADCDRKGRSRRDLAGRRGPTHHKAILNPDMVRQIRQDRANGGMFQWQIAIKHKVSKGTVESVLQGKTWKHVT